MTPQAIAHKELVRYRPEEYRYKSTSPRFRAAAALFASEDEYADLHNASAREWGHAPKDFKKKDKYRPAKTQGKCDIPAIDRVRAVMDAEFRTVPQIGELVDLCERHIREQLNSLLAGGEVIAEKRRMGRATLNFWRSAERRMIAKGDA